MSAVIRDTAIKRRCHDARHVFIEQEFDAEARNYAPTRSRRVDLVTGDEVVHGVMSVTHGATCEGLGTRHND